MYLLFMNKEIGQTIRRLRKANGWTQVELAQRLNASQKVVTTYENNQRTPTLENLKKLAAAFGVSLDELVGVKDVHIIAEQPHMHRNSRVAKVQNLYEKLPPLEQRSILKQIKALVETNCK
jgi:transcriptional regulator with XRE-family HTH domain